MSSHRYSDETQMNYFKRVVFFLYKPVLSQSQLSVTILIVKFNIYLKLSSEIPPVKKAVIAIHIR